MEIWTIKNHGCHLSCFQMVPIESSIFSKYFYHSKSPLCSDPRCVNNYQFDSRVVILVALVAGSAEVVNAARHGPVVAGGGVVVSVRA